MKCRTCNSDINTGKLRYYCSVKCRNKYWATKYYYKFREKILLDQKRKEKNYEWRKTSHAKILRNLSNKRKRKNNEIFKLRRCIKERLKIDKIKQNGKLLEDILGYSLKELWDKISSEIDNAKDGFLNRSLELDHIIPVSAYNIHNISDSEFKKCWSINNLRLITKEENRKRLRKRIDFELVKKYNIKDLLPEDPIKTYEKLQLKG